MCVHPEWLQGMLSSLRRVKDDVREVTAGTECGVAVEGFKDWEVRWLGDGGARRRRQAGAAAWQRQRLAASSASALQPVGCQRWYRPSMAPGLPGSVSSCCHACAPKVALGVPRPPPDKPHMRSQLSPNQPTTHLDAPPLVPAGG